MPPEQPRSRRTGRSQAIFNDELPMDLAATLAKERYDELRTAGVSQEVLRRVEKQIALFGIDACWADYLTIPVPSHAHVPPPLIVGENE